MLLVSNYVQNVLKLINKTGIKYHLQKAGYRRPRLGSGIGQEEIWKTEKGAETQKVINMIKKLQ